MSGGRLLGLVTLGLCACALLCAPAGAQTVPVDVTSLYDLIPLPPSSPEEAYQRAGCSVEAGCDAEAAYQAVSTRIGEVGQQIEIALAASSRPAADPLQGMTPEQLQAKLASMTREEQVAFAMEMGRRQSGAMQMKPEPPAVQAAVAAMQRIMEEIGREAVEGGYLADRLAAPRAELERKHEEIAAWSAENRFMDANGLPGPGWERASAEVLQRYVTAEAEYEQALLVVFREAIADQKARYADFQQKLAAIAYGEEAANDHTRYQLIGVQQAMLRVARTLLGTSVGATRSGAQRRLDQLEFERTIRGGER